MSIHFSRSLAVVRLAAGIVLALTGCEDSGVNAPSDGNLLLIPAVATIVIPEGAGEGSATFTASMFDATGSPLKGVSIRFVASAGSWDQDVTLTNDIGAAQATLTLLITDPSEVDVQAWASTLSADAQAIKTVAGEEPPRAVINETPIGEQQVGSVVIFDGSSSVSSGGPISCYQWTIDSDFDQDDEIVQGAGSSLLNRTYSDEQSMSVILRVSDSPDVAAICNDPAVIPDARFSPLLAAINYTITCANTPPTAVAGADVTAAIFSTVVLDGRGSFDPDGAIVDFYWDCGNGTVAQPNGLPMQAECTYNTATSYTAELTVWDDGVDGVSIDPRTGDLLCQKSATDTLVVTVVLQ